MLFLLKEDDFLSLLNLLLDAVCEEEVEDEESSCSEEEEETVVDEETLLMMSLGLPVAFASSSFQSRTVRLHFLFIYLFLNM